MKMKKYVPRRPSKPRLASLESVSSPNTDVDATDVDAIDGDEASYLQFQSMDQSVSPSNDTRSCGDSGHCQHTSTSHAAGENRFIRGLELKLGLEEESFLASPSLTMSDRTSTPSSSKGCLVVAPVAPVKSSRGLSPTQVSNSSTSFVARSVSTSSVFVTLPPPSSTGSGVEVVSARGTSRRSNDRPMHTRSSNSTAIGAASTSPNTPSTVSSEIHAKSDSTCFVRTRKVEPKPDSTSVADDLVYDKDCHSTLLFTLSAVVHEYAKSPQFHRQISRKLSDLLNVNETRFEVRMIFVRDHGVDAFDTDDFPSVHCEVRIHAASKDSEPSSRYLANMLRRQMVLLHGVVFCEDEEEEEEEEQTERSILRCRPPVISEPDPTTPVTDGSGSCCNSMLVDALLTGTDFLASLLF